MATLSERITEYQNYLGSRLVKWEEGGHPSGDPVPDGVWTYKAYYTDEENTDIVRTDIIKIMVYNYGTGTEEAYWENRAFVPTGKKSFSVKVQEKVNEKVLDETFKDGVVVHANEDTLKAVVKTIKEISGNNEVKYYILTFDNATDMNITSTEQTNYAE